MVRVPAEHFRSVVLNSGVGQSCTRRQIRRGLWQEVLGAEIEEKKKNRVKCEQGRNDPKYPGLSALELKSVSSHSWQCFRSPCSSVILEMPHRPGLFDELGLATLGPW